MPGMVIWSALLNDYMWHEILELAANMKVEEWRFDVKDARLSKSEKADFAETEMLWMVEPALLQIRLP
jgi:hypothetical protein